jgi:hypothetical protein
LSVGSSVWGDANKKPSVAIAQVMAGWNAIGHHLEAHLLDFRSIRQRLHARGPSTQVRGGDAKYLGRSSIEVDHLAIDIDHHDRHINRVKDTFHIGAYRIDDLNVALHPADLTNRGLRLAFYGHSADSFEPW